MTNRTGQHIVIVGGAIGGLTAALTLAGAGARVTLLERRPAPELGGAGLMLQPNGLAVLYGLGLASALQQQACRLLHLRVQDSRGRVILQSSVPDYGEGLDHALVLRRRHLLTVLIDAVRSHPGITTCFQAEALDATSAGQVTVRIDGQIRTLDADLVIGADGVHSRIRERGKFGARVTSTGISYVRGMTPVAIGTDDASETWTSLGLFGMVPVGDGTYFFSSAKAPRLAQAIADRNLAMYKAAWEDAYPPTRHVLAHIARFEDLLVNEVIRVDCERFVDGRLVLLGDAAHAMAPNFGQGANSAIVDAAVLAHELSQNGDRNLALDRYDRRRRPAVRSVQDAASHMAVLADLRSTAVRWGRDHLLRLIGRVVCERAARSAMQEDPMWLLDTTRQLVGEQPRSPGPVLS